MRVPLEKRRRCATHVGMLCDRPEVQQRLPQVVIVNHRAAGQRAMSGLSRNCSPNVCLLRLHSAWNNAHVCTWIVNLLGVALRPFLNAFQPILSLDTVKGKAKAKAGANRSVLLVRVACATDVRE